MTLHQTLSRAHLHSSESPVSETYSKSSSHTTSEKALPPLSRLLDRAWNLSTSSKIGFLIAIVILQVVFYQFIIKRSLSNPSILYKRKEFYSHLGKDKYTMDRLANSHSTFYIIADTDVQNQGRYKSFQLAKCVADQLPTISQKVTTEIQSHANHNEFFNSVMNLKNKIDVDSSWIVRPFKSIWTKWSKSQEFISPYIILKNNENYQEIGSTEDFIDFVSKYFIENHSEIVDKCTNK